MLSAALGAVLQQCDQTAVPYTQADLAQRIVSHLNQKRHEANEQANNMAKHIANLTPLVERFTPKKKDAPNAMADVVRGNISFLENQRTSVLGQIELIDAAMDIAKSHSFRCDPYERRTTIPFGQIIAGNVFGAY